MNNTDMNNTDTSLNHIDNEKIQVEDLKDLTWEQAEDLIGKQTNVGKIIGVHNRPSQSHPEGIYLVAVQPLRLSTHHLVGRYIT